MFVTNGHILVISLHDVFEMLWPSG